MLMYEVSVYPFLALNHVKSYCRSIFLSLLIYRYIFYTTTNDQQKSIAATNNRIVPLITDDFHERKSLFKSCLSKICLFVLFCCFTSQVNSYGHGGTVSSPNHTFS